MGLSVEQFMERQRDHPDLRVELSFKDDGYPKVFVVDRANEVCSWFEMYDVVDVRDMLLKFNRNHKNPIEIEKHGTLANLLADAFRYWDCKSRIVRI